MKKNEAMDAKSAHASTNSGLISMLLLDKLETMAVAMPTGLHLLTAEMLIRKIEKAEDVTRNRWR